MSPSQSAPAPPLPATAEEVLSQVNPGKAGIYRLVRQILDDLDGAAPWDSLYYPPSQAEDFLRMTGLLVAVIEGIPERVDTLAREIEQIEGLEELVGDFEFFFHGIHTSVEQELSKLKALFSSFQELLKEREPSAEERDYGCELSADLKGKYSSSIMGASASLVAEGQWRGVEVEPLLFIEKAQEFDRNQKLVATLTEVTENINNLLEQVPLAELVAHWKRRERVDQYALTALYSLLGNLGKLMREDSRRALYSGDYHQIQRREALLAARVNELATLHNTTWGTVTPGLSVSPEDAFPRMVQTATELATVLNVDILKKIIGDKQVEDLLMVVMLEKEANASVDRWRAGHQIVPHRSRQRIPEQLHSLIVLLYDEDLNTFLELLLGSVLKRASLTVAREQTDGPSSQEMEQLLEAFSEPEALPAAPAAPAAEALPAAIHAAEAPGVVEMPGLAAPSHAPSEPAPEFALPGSTEDAAYRAAAPPEVPHIEIEGLETAAPPPQAQATPSTPEVPHIEIEGLETAVAPPPAQQTPATPTVPEIGIDYSGVDFGAVDPGLGFQAASPAPPPAADPAEPSWTSAGDLDAFEPFEPPADDFLVPASDEPVLASQGAAPGPAPPGAWSTDIDATVWGATSFDPAGDVEEGTGIDSLESSDLSSAFSFDQATGTPPADPRRGEKLSALRDLQLLLDRQTSTTSSNFKAFLMIHNLLRRGRNVPPAMVQSMQPYLYDVMNELLPRLHESQFEDRFGDYANRLIQDCQLLCLPHFGGDELKTRVAPAIQRVSELLDELKTRIAQSIDEVSGLT